MQSDQQFSVKFGFVRNISLFVRFGSQFRQMCPFFIFYEFKNKNLNVLFVAKVTSFIHDAKNVLREYFLRSEIFLIIRRVNC